MDPVHPTRQGKPRAEREGAGAGASPGVHSLQLCQVQHIQSFSCNTWPRGSLHKSLPPREIPSLCLKGGRGPQIEISTSPAFEAPGTQVTMPRTPSRSTDIFIFRVPCHVKSSGSRAVQNDTNSGSTREAPSKDDSNLTSPGLRALGGPARAYGPSCGLPGLLTSPVACAGRLAPCLALVQGRGDRRRGRRRVTPSTIPR